MTLKNFNSYGSKFSLFKFFIKILNKIIYRFLILVNIFPRTEFYFESRYKIIQEYKNNKFRKLIGQFPSLKFLLNFNNIYKINSSAHENFIKIRKRMKNSNNIVFIDSNYSHQDITQREDIDLNKIKYIYFKQLKEKLYLLERVFKKKTEICLHPSSNDKEYRFHLKDFKISKGSTIDKIYKSSIVLFHESSATMDALVSGKKIIILETKILGKYFHNRIMSYKKILKLPSINLDENKKQNKKNILRKIKNSENKIKKYISNNLSADGEKIPSKKIIKILDKFISKKI